MTWTIKISPRWLIEYDRTVSKVQSHKHSPMNRSNTKQSAEIYW